MFDPAGNVSQDVLAKIVQLKIVEPNEVEWLEHIVKEHALCNFRIVFGVTGIDPDGSAYGVHVSRVADNMLEIILDIPAIAVLRSLGRESSMREIARPLRTMPYTQILESDGSQKWRSVQLHPAMARLRSHWITETANLIEFEMTQN